MFPRRLSAIVTLYVVTSFAAANTQESWTPEQRQILNATERLSAATAPGGAGAEAYASVLHEDFSRWALGGAKVHDRQSWVEGVGEWFDDGWRVSDRKVDYLEITIRGHIAFSRRIVTETYQGPNNENNSATAALAEVWIRENDKWYLLRVDAHPMDND